MAPLRRPSPLLLLALGAAAAAAVTRKAGAPRPHPIAMPATRPLASAAIWPTSAVPQPVPDRTVGTGWRLLRGLLALLVAVVFGCLAVLATQSWETRTPPTPDPAQYTVTDVAPFARPSKWGDTNWLRVEVRGPITAAESARNTAFLTLPAQAQLGKGQLVGLWPDKHGTLTMQPPTRPQDQAPGFAAGAFVGGGLLVFGALQVLNWPRPRHRRQG